MDVRDELAELTRETRALLEWEAELSGAGLPEPAEHAGGEAIARGASPSSSTDSNDPADAKKGQGDLLEALGGGPARKPPLRPSRPPKRRAQDEEPATRVLTPPPAEERRVRLTALAEEVRTCTKCGLHEGRTRTVFARGDDGAEIAFIGEGPGYHEDQQGLPFVGRAGKLLDRMIAAMGYAPEEVYIANVVKCRPPENRTPLPDEAGACIPYLHAQLETVAPKIIVALGRTAAEHLECIPPGARGWRGKFYSWHGIPVMATFHPAYLLRNPEQKRPVWEDLQRVMVRLGKKKPEAS